MAQKKGQRGATSVAADDSEVVSRVPLQAVLLADSFNLRFRPITLERPKVLLPLVNVPMIEYTLAWLDSVGVEEVFVFCCSHSQQVKDYLKESEWTKPTSRFSVTTIESHDAISAGDALRVIYEKSVINGDFVLISGDTISNMNLAQALREHKERKKKDPLAVMTMIIKHSKPSNLTHQTRFGTDKVLMAIDPQTKELIFYEDKVNPSQRFISIDKTLLADNTSVYLHNDKQDCYIDICSPEVLSLFMDNFDYQHLRRHFVKGLLVDDIMGYKIFTHEIHSSYAARIDNFRSYGTISKDILQRWTYPLVPNFQYFGNSSKVKLDREGIYKASDIVQSQSARIGAVTLIGSGTTIGNHSVITNSVVGHGCTLGNNVCINGCYIWDNVIIEDDCRLNHAIVCDGVHLRAGVVLEPGVILSFKVEVGRLITIPAYSKVSLRPQPSIQDSDEELEYADASSAVIESPSITSMVSSRNAESTPNYSVMENSNSSEVGIAGVGYIWSTYEGEHEEEWRHSIAPIPEAKLTELSHAYHEEPDVSYQFVNNTPVSGELQLDSESTGFDDGDGGDYVDSTDFDKEVEATFHRALTGVNQETVILEINSLRLSCNKSHADCVGALFFSVMKLGLEAPHSSNSELYQSIAKEINKWKDLLKHYLKSVDEEIEVILKFEEICSETATELSPLFCTILSYLYEKDILSEDAILSWASEKGAADESDKIFVKQSESFITWLKEASEEEDEDEE
ncbi:translation initiation factor eIF-2B subunit epsilon-like [Zingiber officinale]|uniref:translation initiation factor eIF-2B subunit epsilon-like n=1 Tax=Zingiber officinale TaxID=94328 RepID=UPI001C4C8B86|nr:translation initiation factor eIF-2B subunit epsilon-like [Zingiber officinale]